MEKILEPQLQRCMNIGARAGCPYEQVETFIRSGYIPLPWQWLFHSSSREADYEDGPVDIGLGGARGPGKSHAVLSQAALDDCQREPGLKVLFLRQTGLAAEESFSDLVSKVVRGHVKYRTTTQGIKFDNASRIRFGGFKTEKDIDKYIGIEYDVIIVEELNQLTKEKYEKLRGSLRTSKPNWRPRMYTSFNPGGIGHTFVKERYVIPHREKTEGKTRFVPSTYKTNPYLNNEYVEYLEELEGDLGKAWREGEWDLFAGQYFSLWRYDKHVCKPFQVPLSWFRFRSIDPSGRDGITSCHWYAVDHDGRVWVYKEYYYGPKVINIKTGKPYGVGRDYDEHAKEIAKMSEDEDGIQEEYRYTVIDTAAFAKAGYSETAVEVFERSGVTGLIASAKERIVGWDSVNKYLRYDSNQQKPLIQVFSTCVNMIRTIPELQHDEKHPEDLDTKGEDHAADELRYFLRTMRETKAPRILNPVERKLHQNILSENAFDYQYKRRQ